MPHAHAPPAPAPDGREEARRAKTERRATRDGEKQAKAEQATRRKAEAAAAKQAQQAAKTQAKAEQKQRRAMAEANAKHVVRERERVIEQVQVAALARTVRAIASGTWPASFGLALKPGEAALWGGGGQLVEPRRAPGQYQGRSQGVSLRITKGVWYRVGASQGTYVPGNDEQTVIDGGGIVVTTTRVVFRGSRAAREWQFAKMLGAPYGDGGALLMPVSNRQKVSGLTGFSEDFLTHLVAALAIHERGAADVAAELEAEARRLSVPEPTPVIGS